MVVISNYCFWYAESFKKWYFLKVLSQLGSNVAGMVFVVFSTLIAPFILIRQIHCRHGQFVILNHGCPFPNLLWKYETDWNQALHKHKFIISFWFGEKHGRHGKFILIGWNFQNLWNNTSNWNWFAVWYNIVRSSFSFDPTKQYCSHVPFLILNGWNIIENLLWNCYVTWN